MEDKQGVEVRISVLSYHHETLPLVMASTMESRH